MTGTRADFGLMKATLDLMEADNRVKLGICATGAHLDYSRGHTIEEVMGAGFEIAGVVGEGRVPTTNQEYAIDFGAQAAGIAEVVGNWDPDIVLVLGDRSEILAATAVAVIQNRVVVHIHGGERSGTMDELFRHAISKMSHYHLTATKESRQRLIRLGELPDKVFVVGAPGLENAADEILKSKECLADQLGFDVDLPIIMVVFHPVVQDVESVGDQAAVLLSAVSEKCQRVIVMTANSDPGGDVINAIFRKNAGEQFIVRPHFERHDYLSLLAAVDVLVGNSSSGIIEAANYGLWVVNVGNRQAHRERSGNVMDVPLDRDAILRALDLAFARGRYKGPNAYGDGGASSRIAELVATLTIGDDLLNKVNAY